MIVMVSNNTSWRTHFLQGKYGGLGLLLPPNGLRGPYPHLPHYAMDNGAYPAWKNQEPWDQAAFEKALDWASEKDPLPKWVVVPDVVANPDATLRKWDEWAPRIEQLGFTLALAVQDGMTPELVRAHTSPEVVFVGGTREWKVASRSTWAHEFPRVHVGRVNRTHDLIACHKLNIESVDGTGYFRAPPGLRELTRYLELRGDLGDIIGPDELYAPMIDQHPLFPFPP